MSLQALRLSELRTKPLSKAILAFLIIGLLSIGYWFIFVRHLVKTDDAYVSGNLIKISPRVSGTVIEILTDNTLEVAAGDLLVRLDPKDADLNLKKAKSSLALAALEIGSLLAQKDRLDALIVAREKELIMLQSDYERRLKLKTGSSVTAEEVERFLNQTRIAQANLTAAQAELLSTKRLLGDFQPKEHPQIILAAQAVREAHLARDRCDIKSPVSGRVARRTVQLGSEVSPGSSLMAVIPLDEVWIEANFKESQLSRIAPGQSARIEVDMYDAQKHLGTVLGLSPGTGSVFSLLPPENATGNWIKVVQRVPVKISLDPESLKKAPLILGLSARVEVDLNKPSKPLPPKEESLYKTEQLTTDFEEINQEISNIISRHLGLLANSPGETIP